MYHPTSRVLTVLELLQAHGRLSGRELATRLGVDPRTLRRYISRLEELGIPLAVEHGRHGGYMLVPGYKLPPLMFTDEEALGLAVGLLAAQGVGIAGNTTALATAQAKLERVMPHRLRERVHAAGETIALDLPRHAGASSPDAATLGALAAAAQARQRVALEYRSSQNAPTRRDFDPYGLVYRGACWYAVGHCHLRKGLRSFRVDRIRSLRTLDIRFERPADFDALGHVAFTLATLPRAHAVEALLRTDFATARREIFPTLGLLEPVPDGVLLFAQTDDLGWLARELARLPFAFEVRRPAELRDAVRAHARRLLACAAAAR